jgi:hypothetical protein
VIEGDNPDLFGLPKVEPTEIDREIAAHILEKLKDGICIQLGIPKIWNN